MTDQTCEFQDENSTMFMKIQTFAHRQILINDDYQILHITDICKVL